MAYIYDSLSKVHVVTLPGKVRMIPVIQSGMDITKGFASTVEEATKLANLTACINSQWYGLSSLGPSSNEGITVLGTGEKFGKTSPNLWSISQTQSYEWIVKFGDPPISNIYTSVGGLAPLIINGLQFGESNRYSRILEDSVLLGEPKLEHKPYLLQRSSKKFSQLNMAKNKGKAGIGIRYDGSVVLIIEPDDTASLTYVQFRDYFKGLNCLHALACDGSDSVFLNYKKEWIVKAGTAKNATQTSGIGFRVEN